MDKTNLWRRHNDDEAQARALQQEAAGDTHRPVSGTPPYGDERVNAVALDVARSERERCAAFVEGWALPADAPPQLAALLRELAQALRQLTP